MSRRDGDWDDHPVERTGPAGGTAPPAGPPLAGGVVARGRLLDLLGTALGGGVVRVSAGAGYGKTALLASWLDRLDRAADVAWLSVETRHSDPSVLIAELWEVLAAAGIIARGDPVTSPAPLADDLRARSARHRPSVVVLDDVGLLRGDAAQRCLRELVERLPDGICLVLSGREDPTLPWNTLRARRRLVEIRSADLLFDEVEALLLLERLFGLAADDPRVVGAIDRAQGWAAALVLAGISIQSAGRGPDAAPSTREAASVRGFLEEAVIDACDPELLDFMERTCLLPVLDPVSCDELTGRDDSLVMLRGLVSSNLLTEETTGDRAVFRCHPLLRETLRSRVELRDPERVQADVERAARSLLERGLLTEAADAIVEGGDPELATAIIRRASGHAISQGEAAAVMRWLSRLPAEHLRRQPDLQLLLGRAAGLAGDKVAATAATRDLERRRGRGDLAGVRVCLPFLSASIRVWQGELTSVIDLLRRQLALLEEHPDDETAEMLGLTRESVQSLLAAGYLLRGELHEAVLMADAALSPWHLDPPSREAVLSIGAKALALAWAGDEGRAYEEVRAGLPVVAGFQGGTTDAFLFWAAAAWVGPEEDAEPCLARTERVAASASVPLVRALPAVIAPHVLLRLGRFAAAEAALARARRHLELLPEPGHLAVVLDGLALEIDGLPGARPSLTDQETRVLEALSRGLSRGEIAAELHYSVNTVKTHLRTAYRKLGARGKGEALARARAWELVASHEAAEAGTAGDPSPPATSPSRVSSSDVG